MKHSARRSKGRKGEQAVGCLLSRWYYGCDDALTRTHGSRTSVRLTDQVGDLGVCKTGLKPWVFGVEVKHQEDWDLESLLGRGEKPKILKFWAQTVKACRETGKIPLMIAKRRYKPYVAGLPSGVLASYIEANFTAEQWDHNKVDELRTIQVPHKGLALVDLDSLLQATTAKGWRKVWRVRCGAHT